MKSLLLILALVLHAAPTSAQSSPGRIGDFALMRNVDPVTKVNRSSIMTPGDVARGRNAALTWRCTDKGVEVMFTTRHTLGRGSVQPRVGARPFMNADDWNPAAHGRAATLRPDAVAAFTAGAKSAGSMVFRVEDPRGGVSTYTVGLRGLQDALAWLSCGS